MPFRDHTPPGEAQGALPGPRPFWGVPRCPSGATPLLGRLRMHFRIPPSAYPHFGGGCGHLGTEPANGIVLTRMPMHVFTLSLHFAHKILKQQRKDEMKSTYLKSLEMLSLGAALPSTGSSFPRSTSQLSFPSVPADCTVYITFCFLFRQPSWSSR